MRIHVGRASGRLVLLGSAVAGAVVATRDVHPDAVDATTRAACVAELPGTAARCSTDHAAAQLVPYLLPALGGVAAGLLAAIVVLGTLRLVGRTARAPTAPVPASSAPSWLVVPPAGAHGPGRVLGPTQVRAADAGPRAATSPRP